MKKTEFSQQFSKLYLPLCMYALRITENTETAEDCVQDAFIAALHNIENIPEKDSFKSYMYVAVRNKCISAIKHYIRNRDISDIENLNAVSSEEIDNSERDAELWKALSELPERCRRIFLMSKRDDMSNKEIAEALSISVKTVENQMTKAFHRLRLNLSDSTSQHRHILMMFL